MKKILTILFMACCISMAADAQAAKKLPAGDFQIEPYVMNVTETSFTVLFKTTSESMCWVEVAPDDDSDWYGCERPRFYQDVSGRHFTGYYHRIEVSGLMPGTSYRYRVIGRELVDAKVAHNLKFGKSFAWNPAWGNGHKYANTCTMRTLDPNDDQCKFSVFNDIHFRDDHFSALAAGAPADNDFTVLNGDIVSSSQHIDSVLKHTFTPIRELASTKPVFYARGNHESRGAHWYRLPDCFPTSTGQFYYTFRQGPVAFLVLDAGEDKPDNDIEYSGTAAYDKYRLEELEWMKKAVKDPEFASAPRKICIIHIATLKEKNAWYSQGWVTEHYTKVLRDAGVSLMISGHHHRFIFSSAENNDLGYSVFVNSNEERLDVVADAEKVELKSYDSKGNLLHSEIVK